MNSTDPHSKKQELARRVNDHLQKIYPNQDWQAIGEKICHIMGFHEVLHEAPPYRNLWDETDIVTITYGDSIIKDGEYPLETLNKFFLQHMDKVTSAVHILPFYPFSSDDGFAVINYTEVNQSLGHWDDINRLSKNFKLMADLVINHCSSRSLWFENYKQNKSPGKGYFIEAKSDADLSDVVRPRTSPLLRETETAEGTKYVWCTFSHDQVDVNFENPDVLLEFISIIKMYLDQGISIFRLDAIAFLWKEIGTQCINHINTHEVIRLLRLLIEHRNSEAIIITETNIPNRENLSYFGNANEAHLIYNFALPPLVLYTMLAGKSNRLKQWLMSMPPAQNGTTYFNFIASHDGIGLRPVENLLLPETVDDMAKTMQQFGGDISWRAMPDGSYRPYELNISLIDAMKGTFEGEDEYQLDRFVCAHAIMLALEGMPAFYIHSLLATPNDTEKVERTSNKRSINRHNWNMDELLNLLSDPQTINAQAFTHLKELIRIRKRQRAFHPNATQFTMHFGDNLFAFWRQSQDRMQSLFCIYNITNTMQEVALQDVNLIDMEDWHDLLTDRKYEDPREVITLAPYQFVWIANR